MESFTCRNVQSHLKVLVVSPPAGAFKRDRVFGGGTQGVRGAPPPGPTHARGPAHLLRPALEPHRLDESVAGAQQTVPHVQQEADAGGRRRVRRGLHQTPGDAESFVCADVTR